jgi:hypothetical protein
LTLKERKGKIFFDGEIAIGNILMAVLTHIAATSQPDMGKRKILNVKLAY